MELFGFRLSSPDDLGHSGASAEERIERLVKPPPSATRVTKYIAAAFILSLVGAVVLPWRQNVKGTGRVTAFSPDAREARIEAAIAGRVLKWHHVEGDLVEAGMPIVELADNDPNLVERLQSERDAIALRLQAEKDKAEALKTRATSLERQVTATISAAKAKLRVADQKVESARLKLQAKEAELHTAQINAERVAELNKNGLVSSRQLELAEMSRLTKEAAVATARAEVTAAQSEQASQRAEIEKARAAGLASVDSAKATFRGGETDVATTQAKLARLDVGIARQNALIVKAPRRGILQHVVARQPGEQVNPGDIVAVLVPLVSDRAVEILVSGNDAPLIRPGTETRVQFEGWPAIQFAGWPSIAVGSFAGEVAFVDSSGREDGLFRVVVRPTKTQPWPEAGYLRQGTRARAWFLLREVPLGYELWRQVNGFPPALDQKIEREDLQKRNKVKPKTKTDDEEKSK